MVKAIVGACWGDEGKGKITDVLAEDSDIVVRFQGGSNAGHTIICDYGNCAPPTALGCLLPAYHQHHRQRCGPGREEVSGRAEASADGGVPAPHIIVDQRTQLLMSYHVLLDSYEEERLAGAAFGSTKSGIAPSIPTSTPKSGFRWPTSIMRSGSWVNWSTSVP